MDRALHDSEGLHILLDALIHGLLLRGREVFLRHSLLLAALHHARPLEDVLEAHLSHVVQVEGKHRAVQILKEHVLLLALF